MLANRTTAVATAAAVFMDVSRVGLRALSSRRAAGGYRGGSRVTSKVSRRSRAKPGDARRKKEEPRRGECRGSYALHRTHDLPRPNTTGHIEYALCLWQFFDDSLSVFLIATSICTRALTPH